MSSRKLGNEPAMINADAFYMPRLNMEHTVYPCEAIASGELHIRTWSNADRYQDSLRQLIRELNSLRTLCLHKYDLSN